MPVARRKERRFSLPDNFSISDYMDDELRSQYRFGRESIAFLVDILRDDLESISNPFNAENPGVSSRISMIFSLAWEGCFGAGPPPLFFVSRLKVANSFFTTLCRFFHLTLTSCMDRLARPTALTAFVISFHSSFFLLLLVMAFVNLTVKYRCFSAHFQLWRKSSSLKNLAFSFSLSRHRQLVAFPPFAFHAIFPFSRRILARSTIFFRARMRMTCLTGLM